MKSIFATLGPASWKPEIIRQMANDGVNLFRINLSHEPLENVADRIKMIRSATDVDICIDSEGGQIRTCNIKNKRLQFKEGETVAFNLGHEASSQQHISFTPAGVVNHFQVGDVMTIDFNLARFEIIEKTATHCLARVLCSGDVRNNKAVTLFRELPLPAVTPKDRAAFALGRSMGIRHFALSFASCAADVEEVRSLIGPDCTVIAKIESRKALANLSEIIKAADEVLIDRGDLSREVPIEKIPFLQRRIISAARLQQTPIHVATNLLESMCAHREPTRAEVNDIVSTLLMGCNGLVLAAETAIGQYPAEAVRMIRRIIDMTSRWTENTSLSELVAC